MIINHKHKFIFIKTTKTAGTSLEIALSQFCDKNDVVTPISPDDEEARRALGGKGPCGHDIPLRFYTKYDVLRLLARRKRKKFHNHSTARYIRENIDDTTWDSYFKFSIERNPYDKAISRYFWSNRSSENEESIRAFLESVDSDKLSNWDIYTINDHVALDFIVRYERLEEDLNTLSERIGLPPLVERMPKAKSGYRKVRRPYAELLDPESRKRIEIVCAKEIQRFGYTWEV